MCIGNPCMSQTHSHSLLQKRQSISLREEEEEARQNAFKTWSSATFKLNISAYLFTPAKTAFAEYPNVNGTSLQGRQPSQVSLPRTSFSPWLLPFFICPIFLSLFLSPYYVQRSSWHPPNSSWFVQWAPPALDTSKSLWFAVIMESR